VVLTDGVEILATVARVATLADQGIRITFDLSEDSVLVAAYLMECKRWGTVVKVSVVPELQVSAGGKTGDVETRGKRQSQWTSAEMPCSH
jgi:hypothetical protein